MRIFFGNALEGCPAPAHWQGLGRLVCGRARLLDVLEQNLGLPPISGFKLDRVLDFREALEAAAKDAFYERSLNLDPLASARTLMRWRDELALAGWDAEGCEDAPARIRDLAAAEQELASETGKFDVAARLRRVLAEIQAGKNHGVAEIVRETEPMPELWSRLLGELGAKTRFNLPTEPLAEPGTQLHALQRRLLGENGEIAANSAPDESIRLFRAYSEAPLADCAANFLADPKTALIGKRDSLPTLNRALELRDQPRVPATERSSAAAPAQLLLLALRLRWEPFDPQAWLEFLLHPVCPLNDSFRFRLARAINDVPGRGNERWNDAIARSLESAPNRKNAEKLAETWIDASTFPAHPGAPGEALAETARNLAAWFGVRGANLENSRESAAWLAASRSILAFAANLRRQAKISRLQLERLAAAWLPEAASGESTSGEAGQPFPLDSPRQLLEPADRVIWWQPAQNEAGGHDRSPWTNAERTWLRENGAMLIDPAENRAERLATQVRPILMARHSLTLFHTTSSRGRIAPQPAVITRLLAECGPEIEREPEAATPQTRIPVKPLPAPRQWWKLAAPGLLLPREKESYSALHKLIYSPYQWVFDYAAKLRPGPIQDFRVRDDARRQGSLLHGFVESLLEPEPGEDEESIPTPGDASKAPATGLLQTLVERLLSPNAEIDWRSVQQSAVETWVAANWEQLLAGQAAHYLIPGHESSRQSLLYLAQTALWELITQLRDAGVVEAHCEEPISGVSFGAGELTGAIDLHVVRADGEHGVIDLKLGGRTFRQRELSENRHLQLALYGHAISAAGGAKPPHCAYFVFRPHGALLARSQDFFRGATVAQPKSGADSANSADWEACWREFQQIWSWRWDQLEHGEIEFTLGALDHRNFEIPPVAAWKAGPDADRFNPYPALTGWPATA